MSDTTNQQALQKSADAQAGSQRDLGTLLTSQAKRITEMSAGVLTPERLTQLAILATRKTTALQKCSVGSVVMACMDAARLGLEPDGVQGAIIPYKGEAAFQPMYRGLCALAYREGTVEAIEVRIAFEGDLFEVELGTTPRIVHRPSFTRSADAKPICWYAVAHMRGVATFDLMLPFEIEAIHKRSPSFGKSSSPWDTDYDEMGKKTVIKRLLKKLPASARLRDAMTHDNEIDGIISEPAEKPGKIVASATDKLLGAAGKKKKEEPAHAEGPPLGFDDNPERFDEPDHAPPINETGRVPPLAGVGPPAKPLTIDAVAAASKIDDDTTALDALLRAMPTPAVHGSCSPDARKAPLIAHCLAAKAINDAAFRVAVLVARSRLGDVTSVPAERAILDAALARIGAAGGWVQP